MSTSPQEFSSRTVTFQDSQQTQTALPSGKQESAPPVRIPGYEVLGELGRGGMGVVYRARQLGLNRLVALKMILSGSHAGAHEVSRFRAEAESVARLQHPNIVQVYEVGEVESRVFCALELVEGGTLAQYLAGTPRTPQEAAGLVQVIAQAVQAAHDAGIIHRDLKPANVLLASGGREPPVGEETGGSRPPLANLAPKITDFGIAKQQGSESGQTQTGQVLGTPSYMAPEQASGRGKEVGPAADVYALGAILYECLTGRPPFKGASILETLEQVRSQEPVPPSRLQPSLPRDLETICLKCLEKEPGRRYGSARELAEDLGRFRAGEPIRARPVPAWERGWKWARRRPALASLAAALVLAVIALAGMVVVVLGQNEELREQTAYANEQANRASQREQEVIQANQREQQKSREALEKVIRLNVGTGARYLESNDLIGSLPNFVAAHREEIRRSGGREEAPELWSHRQRLGMLLRLCPRPVQMWPNQGVSQRTLPGTVQLSGGGRVLGRIENAVQIWDVQTGEQVGPNLTTPQAIFAVALAPDGTRVGLLDLRGKVILRELSSGKVLVETGDEALGHRSHPAFSGDGNWFLAARGNRVQVWNARTGEPRPGVIQERGDLRIVRVSFDGSRVLTADDTTMHLWDAAGRVVGSLDKIRIRHAEFSPTKPQLALATDAWAQVFDLATLQPLTPQLEHGFGMSVQQLLFSPGGDRLLTWTLSNSATELRTWSIEMGRAVFQAWNIEEVGTAAAHSPEGRLVAVGTQQGSVQIWDTMTRRVVFPRLRHTGMVEQLAFSPEGRYLHVWSEHEVRVWDLCAGFPARVPLQGVERGYEGVFSQDGARVVVTSFRSAREYEVQVWDALTGKPVSRPVRVTSQATRTVSPDGRRLAVVGTVQEQKGGSAAITVWDLGASPPARVELPSSRLSPRVLFSPDGRRLVTSTPEGPVRVWDTTTGKPVSPPLGSFFQSPAFSPDGAILAMGGRDEVRLWSLPSGNLLFAPVAHKGLVTEVVFSPDGRWLATGAGTTVRVWEVATGQPVTPLLPHSLPVSHLCFSPDGRTLATAANLGMIKQGRGEIHAWDLPSGQALFSPLQHSSGSLIDLRFSPDGRILLALGGDGLGRLLEPRTGEPLGPRVQHRGISLLNLAIVFSPDGRQIQTLADYLGGVCTWDLTPLAPGDERLEQLAPLLAGQRPGPGGILLPLTPWETQEEWKRFRKPGTPGYQASAAEVEAWRRQVLNWFDRTPQVGLAHLEALIAAHPDEIELHLRRAQLRQQLKQYDESLAELTALLRKDPGPVLVWETRARLQALLGRWEQAEADYGEALTRDGTRLETWLARGNARAEQQRWKAAVEDFSRAIELGSDDGTAWQRRVLALLAAGDVAGAQATTAQAWGQLRGEARPSWRVAVRIALLCPGESVNRQALLKASDRVLIERRTGAEENLLQAAALCRAGQFDRAAERLGQLLPQLRGDLQAWCGLFLALARHGQGKMPEARKALEDAIAQIERLIKQPGESALPWTTRQELLHLKAEVVSVVGGN